MAGIIDFLGRRTSMAIFNGIVGWVSLALVAAFMGGFTLETFTAALMDRMSIINGIVFTASSFFALTVFDATVRGIEEIF